jgi:hypothetical protein
MRALRTLGPLLTVTVACAPLDEDVATRVEGLTAPVLASCSEAQIRANAPPDARTMLDRAYTWIHRAVPYCQCVTSGSSPFRADCSGFVSMVWGLSAPGHTTYSFAGGPWADSASVRLRSREQLRVGDALNYPGDFRAGTGHVVLFGGWLDRRHTRFCSLEESHRGTPARVIVRNVDAVYIPIRKAGRQVGPLCDARCSGGVFIDGDCERHSCGTGRCVDDSHGARCVDRGCPTWGADAVCLDSRTVITCVNGDRRSSERCTGANPRCLPEGTRVRCESPTCAPTGRHDLCLPSGEITTCSNGRMGAARDCPTGTFCSDPAPTDARCVSRLCVAAAGDTPVARTACMTGGTVLRCDANGAATTTRCPSGQACSIPDGNRCVAFACPAGVRAAVCAGNERVVCDRGVIVERGVCDGTCAASDGTAARCVATACATRGADGRATLGPAHGVCLSAGVLGFCDDEGHIATTPCATGARCTPSGGSASCVDPAAPPPPADAGGPVVTPDAGEPEDAEAPVTDPDAGLLKDPDYDSGPLKPDAVPPPEGDDAAVRDLDAGESVTTEVRGGCAVGAPRGGHGGALALLLAARWRRRRRA